MALSDITELNSVLTYLFLFIAGACFGSFLNCLSWRLIHHESVVKGRSHCDFCGHVLGASDLIPVISYITHGGKCKWCGAKLSRIHLIGEIITGLVFVSLYWKYGFSLKGFEYLLFACLLIACSFADLEGMIIPDVYLLIAIGVRIFFILISGNIIDELVYSMIGGFLVGGLMLGFVLLFEKITGKEAMGGGDLKLFFVTGLYFGGMQNILCIFLAALIGIVFALCSGKTMETEYEKKKIPFGPSIALSAWAVMLFGETIINAYLALF